jgi:hypothetical protein
LGRAAQWLLAAAAAPLFIAFAWQATIATVGDDSVSYLAMARWFAGSAGAQLEPWLGWHSHFPPLFPIVLAATGGAHDFLVAHVVVAVFAVACIPLLARLAALRLESDWAGFWVAAAFLALPTAWLGAKGILSETLYLALSLGALVFHERRIERGSPRTATYAVFGLLLAAAYATRAVGVVLVAAYAIHEIVRARSLRMPRGAWLALAPVALVAIAWPLARPGGHVYGQTLANVIRVWTNEPMPAAEATLRMFTGGWIASFVAEGEVPLAVRAVLYATGIAAVAGSIRAALANRIDGWYALLTLLLLLGWVFGVDTMRRLFYPVVPLLLLHGVEMLAALASRFRLPHPRMAVAAVAALPFAVSAPAMVLVAEKATDATAAVEGGAYRLRDITDYYRIMNFAQARAFAAKHAATLAGLEALRTRTPPGARVMWMRPEYVALLGGRDAVPSYYDWDARTLAAHVLDGRVDYIVVAGISKSDLAMASGEAATTLRAAAPYTRPVFALANPFNGEDEFILLAVDRAALAAFLGP